MKILAIETSCDETACAVVEDGTKILSSVVASSAEMHKKYGGIVPEIAAREQLKCIIPVIEEALSMYSSCILARSLEINSARSYTDSSQPSASNNIKTIIDQHVNAIAVTVGPGLIGSLLVGVETAKTIAFVTGKPIIPVNHVLAHMYANFLDSNQENSSRAKSRDNLIEFPAISLVVSGGHTELYLMRSIKDLVWLGGTLDDAAGECFDKSARLLGFGSGGGMAIEKAASQLKIKTLNLKLPRPMMKDESLNFSFSGLKTAIIREWKKYHITPNMKEIRTSGVFDKNESLINAFAFEVQEAITDVLVEKTLRAAEMYNAKSILMSGGVAANSRLRDKFKVSSLKFKVAIPQVSLCTDNAVAIASYTYFRGKPSDWHEVTAMPDLYVEV